MEEVDVVNGVVDEDRTESRTEFGSTLLQDLVLAFILLLRFLADHTYGLSWLPSATS